jgi:hypothetical protein
MSRFTLAGTLVFALVGVAALPAAAEVFHVALKNGTVLDTQSQPQEASWDDSMVLLLTDVGNWIGVTKADIDSVSSDTAIKGYGIRINASTIALGWSPNDQPVPEEEQPTELAAQRSLLSDAYTAYLAQQSQQQQTYTQQQFVEPEGLQGIPAGFVGGGNNTVLVPPPQ